MLTYQVPDSIQQIAKGGEFNEFDLNVFFSVKKNAERRKKRKMLALYMSPRLRSGSNLIRGSYLPSNIDNLKLGQDKKASNAVF